MRCGSLNESFSGLMPSIVRAGLQLLEGLAPAAPRQMQF
jgi:hypothetical protein